MDDLAAKLQSILSSPEGQEQLKNIQSMLGMSGQEASAQTGSPAGGSASGGPDLSSLLNSLGGGNGAQNAVPASGQSQTGQGGFDLSSLLGMLGNSGGGQNQPQAASDGGAEANTGMPNIDVGMILKLQQVFQSMKVNDKNSQLLLALKPHFGQNRQMKVDQAISMMRLFSMLPMLKESGIFSGL